MSDHSEQMLSVLAEMRDLLRLIAEPAIAERDKKFREALRVIGGKPEQKCDVFTQDESGLRRGQNGGPKARRSSVLAPTVVLFLLRADPADALDRQRRAAGFLGDLAVLLHDVATCRLVAVEPAEQLGRHAPVGALGVVFINDIEKGKFAFGIGSGFFGHGGASRR